MRREPLQGREREQTLLVEALESAASGRGTVATLSGPAGIGKSALAEFVADEAQGRKLEVVRGRAWEFADAPPYFPVGPALRALGVEANDANAFALWEKVLGALAHAPEPQMWLLEDLHAADLLTLDLLVFLSQPVRSLPVLIVVTTRDADPRIDERAAQRLLRLAREGVDLRLGPLSPDDVAAVAERLNGRPLGARERAHVVARAEGNPLFVREMALASRSSAADLDGAVPPTIRKLVEERVSRLPQPTRRALAAGAILGREFAAGTVARMLGILPARAVDDLAPALHAGLVLEPRPGVFVFGHVLERDAVEDGLPAGERATLHAAAEAAIATTGSSPSVLVERARHALLGGSGENEARTLSLVKSVLAELEEKGAYDRALSLHARLEEARRSGFVASAASPEDILGRALLAHRAGHHAACRADCDEVVAIARRTGDGRLLARAALTAFAELRPGVVDPSTVALLEEARAALPPDDVSLVCRVEARLASALQPAKEPLAVAARARAAIATARATGDEALIGEVLVTGGSALIDYSPVEERRALARELAERATRSGDRDKLLRARSRLAVDDVETGDFAAFDAGVDAMLELSLEAGHPRHRFRPLLFASMRACMHGRFAESERLLVEVDQLAVLTDDPALPLSLGAHRGLRARDTEDVATLGAVAANIVHVLVGIPEAATIGAVLRAALYSRAGDRARTAHELVHVERSLDFVLGDGTIAYLSVEPVALAGSDPLRAAFRERILPFERCEVATGHVPVTYEGSVLRLLAILDAALGDVKRAEERFREALERARRGSLAPFVARIASELASLLERRGANDESRALFAESDALAAELGMPLLVRTPRGAPSSRAEHTELSLARRGDVFHVRGGEHDVTVRDSRGMRLLARLVEQRGRDLHVLVLASDEGAAGALADSDAGERIDASALRAYKTRLDELRAELDDAQALGDAGRAGRLRAERTAIEDEVRASTGLGERRRKAGSVTERARVNVQRRLKDAVSKIAEADAALGRRFAAAVRTGTYCSFSG
ncbi:MAG TPA: AAA family ATPase [Polyangiaceae bacterium]|nr:AAA family ATPase [Polyangiaceae bacterium]